MPSSHLILCRTLLLLPSIFPSIRVFSIESALCIRWPKYWSFIFSISPSNEYSGLILCWISLQSKSLKSLLQHHSSKASLRRSAFFILQLSHPYMTTGKTIALTRRTLAGKVMLVLTTGFYSIEPVTSKEVPSVLASSVCWSFQCLISTLTQRGGGGQFLRLTCSVVLWGGRDAANKQHWHVLTACVLSLPTQLRL